MLVMFLAASAVVLLCVMIQSVAVDVCVRCYARLMQPRDMTSAATLEVRLIFLMVMCLLAGHLFQIACWGVFFAVLGAFSDFQTSLYFAGATFTTIGYGDVVLPPGRYMLGPLVGITGLLMLGVSTAVMAAAVTNMINRRLAHLRECRQSGKKVMPS